MWLRMSFACAAGLVSMAAQASCRFPAERITSPAKVAALLLETNDFVGFAQVSKALDTRAGHPEELEVLLPFKGPEGILELHNPMVSPGVITVTNSSPSFYSKPGSIVFGALTRGKDGWVRGECGQQLLHMFPLQSVVTELRRANPHRH